MKSQRLGAAQEEMTTALPRAEVAQESGGCIRTHPESSSMALGMNWIWGKKEENRA